MEKYNYKVEEFEAGERVDKYLSLLLPEYSRSYIQKVIKEGCVLANEQPLKANYKIQPEDTITIEIPDQKEPDIQPENIPLSILYEDSELLVVDKPKGMVVHPSAGHYTHTLVNALLFHCQGQLSGINGVLRPGIVHRIDMNTTGALVVCKTDRAHQSLALQLKDHSITRRYRAIVHGNLKEDEGTVTGDIGRHPTERKKMAVTQKNGKPAVTHYRVLERFGSFTYIECRLETGRTHQIRVHMSSIRHPLLGDDVYGPKNVHSRVSGARHCTQWYWAFSTPFLLNIWSLQHLYLNTFLKFWIN